MNSILRMGRAAALAASLIYGAPRGAEGTAAEIAATRAWVDNAFSSPERAPFAFTLGGRVSGELLKGWRRTASPWRQSGDAAVQQIQYADPASGLEVSAEVTRYDRWPAVAWILHITNNGRQTAPVLEDFQALRYRQEVPDSAAIHIHRSRGSRANWDDFQLLDEDLPAHGHLELEPDGGRSSSGVLPFFNMEERQRGVLAAIGWSGQWNAIFDRSQAGQFSLRAGMQYLRIRLAAGERIRSPRILLTFWTGPDWVRGNNLFRQLALEHYQPRVSGELVRPPIAKNTAYDELANASENTQIEAIRKAGPLGVEAHWLDAYWFQGGFPSGVGNWGLVKPDKFPHGLRPLADAAHAAGMKFILWYEPERAAAGTQIAREHPEFLLRAGESGISRSKEREGSYLVNLGSRPARNYIYELLSRGASEHRFDILRIDFNISPLPFWRQADSADGTGLTEMRYIEGLYSLWEQMSRKHPGMWVDNCASGGRRLDLETMAISLPLWRSDSCDHYNHNAPVSAVADQVESALSLWIPQHELGVWGVDPYTWRSGMSGGGNVLYMDIRKPDFSAEEGRAAIRELKELRPYFLGDFYPLLLSGPDWASWTAYQYDRPDLGSGFAVFFRRPQSPYPLFTARLRGLDQDARYEVSLAEGYSLPKAVTVTGRELQDHTIRLDSKPGCVLLRYKRKF